MRQELSVGFAVRGSAGRAGRRATSDEPMRKKPETDPEVREMRAEYDFSGGVRGKYAERYAAGTNIVVLEPEVAESFPSSESVNAALREVLRNRRNQRASG